jgi:hypothetical protein
VLHELYGSVPSFTLAAKESLPQYAAPHLGPTPRHGGLSRVLRIVQTPSVLILIQDVSLQNLSTLCRFHSKSSLTFPTLGREMGLAARDQRMRYICYQIVHTVSFLHSLGLCLDPISMASLEVDNDLWVTLLPTFSSRMISTGDVRKVLSRRPSLPPPDTEFIPVCPELDPSVIPAIYDSDDEVETYVYARMEKSMDRSRRDGSFISNMGVAIEGSGGGSSKDPVTPLLNLSNLYYSYGARYVDKPPSYDVPITLRWIEGKISNFEYIMAINYAAGRSLSDVQHHAVLPWVTDFRIDPTQGYYDENALRDLTKTKFRLSKGDRQLETTFMHSEPVHHIPEVLAELTYTIYMARRVPMHVLQNVVRSYFVPEHYPFSMNRMYEWSPDECIPEFFMDPSVFESIHTDVGLMDIQLPDFAPTPHQFIRYHRSILESNHVSANIHHWIDLTFGCSLVGQRAIDNLNVPLQHSRTISESTGGTPDLSKHPGFVVIFNSPHPQRCLEDTGDKDGLFELYYAGDSNSSSSSSNIKQNMHTSAEAELEVKESMKDYASLENFNRDVSKAVNMRIAAAAINKPLGGEGEHSLAALGSSPLTTTSPLAAMHMSMFDTININKEKASVIPQTVSEEKSLSGSNRDNVYDSGILKASKHISISDDKDSSVLRDVCQRAGATESMKFARHHSARLEPAVCFPFDVDPLATTATTTTAPTSSEKDVPCFSGYDHVFFEELDALGNDLQTDYAVLGGVRRSSADVALCSLEILQGIDMTFLGLIFSDMFGGWPLCSVQDALENTKSDNTSLKKLQRFVYNDKRNSALPMCVKRLLVLLLNPNRLARPTSHEILASCMLADKASNTEEEGFMSPPILRNNNNSKLRQKSENDVTSAAADTESGFLAMHDKLVRASSIKRTNFLSRHCGSLFPSFFSTIHTFVCRLKSAHSEEQQIAHLINNLDVLESLPLDGVSMILPHVLVCISSAGPYISDEQKNSEKEGTGKKRKNSQLLVAKYPRIVDALAARLGVNGTDVHIVPAVMRFVEGLHCPSTLIYVLRGDLLNVLANRGGARCFLRSVLPALTTLMIAGSLQSLLGNRRQSIYHSGAVPLWASMEQESFELTEWLIHTVSKRELQDVQEAATGAVVSLACRQAMGPALCLRFVLPAILCLVCNPNLAVTGYYTEPLAAEYHKHEMGKKSDETTSKPAAVDSESAPVAAEESDSDNDLEESRPAIATIPTTRRASVKLLTVDSQNDAIDALSVYEPRHMYAVRALDGICQHSGVSATIDLVLPHLLQNIFPNLEKFYDLSNRKSSAALNACILELVSTVGSMLHMLSPAVVVNNFFVKQKSSGFCLINMLVDVPMPPCEVLEAKRTQSSDSAAPAPVELVAADAPAGAERVVIAIDEDADSDSDSDRFNELLHFFRSYRAFLELCKLVTTLANHVGRDLTLEYVIPVVNKFFGNFVSSFSGLPVMSLAMSQAFNIAVQLFIPLVQLIGPEAFSTSVYNLNPRLEVWLHSLAFEKVSRSPPLPSNILPEAVTESEKKTESREGRLSRFLPKWMTPGSAEKDGHGSSTSSSTSSNVGGGPSQPSSRPGRKGFINDSSMGPDGGGSRQTSGEFEIKYNTPPTDAIDTRTASSDSMGAGASSSAAGAFGQDSTEGRDGNGPILGVSSKLQIHTSDSSKGQTPTWSPKKSFGSGKRGSINIFKEPSDQISVGGQDRHMAGVEPADYDSAWLLTGMHRWRCVGEEGGGGGGSLVGKPRSGTADGQSQSASKSKADKHATGPAAIAFNLNAGLSNSRRRPVPAAQLSMTAPKVTVDTASEAGSLFSLSMVSKVQLYPDEVGTPVKLMVTNSVESLLMTGHANGRVKIFNINAHPLSSEAVYNGHYAPQSSDAGKHKDSDKHHLSGGVFCGGFMRDSSHAFTCDGSIRVWDIETQRTIAEHNAGPGPSDPSSARSFSFCAGVCPQDCVLPDIGPHGDDILLACMGSTLHLLDVRLRMKNNLSAVAEWRLPIPSLDGSKGSGSSSTAESTAR